MYPFHPFTVHFPIALLLAHGLLTLVYLRRKERALETSAYHCLILGWFGALVATLTGLLDAARQLTGPDALRADGIIGWVNAHAAVGIALVLVYGQILLRRRRHPLILEDDHTRGGYLRLTLIGVILVVINGWLGGYLVYWLGLGQAQ